MWLLALWFAGLEKNDESEDVRYKHNYTEATLANNAALVAALHSRFGTLWLF